jgi:hypothetical protein
MPVSVFDLIQFRLQHLCVIRVVKLICERKISGVRCATPLSLGSEKTEKEGGLLRDCFVARTPIKTV